MILSSVRDAQPIRNAVKQLARLPSDLLTLAPHVSSRCLPSSHASHRQQPSARPPAHVGPQPGLLPVRSPVLAVGNVHPGQPLHERSGLQQPGGRILDDPHERVEVRHDLEHQHVALLKSSRAQTGLAQTMSKCPGGNSGTCSPSSGAQISTRCPGRRLPSPPPRRLAAKQLQQSRHV